VANILFLLSEIVEKQFLERTPFLHKAAGQDIAILARVANKCTYLMKCYIDTRKVYFKKEATYIDLASILYSESMLTQFLSNF
jgi:ethanolamine utilization protein EutP (predicted NTPase)